MRVFVLDDDAETCEVVERALIRAGHDVTTSNTFEHALDHLLTHDFDVLVLDVMLGAETGLDLCMELRARDIETPTLFLSARGAVRARIEGFEAGGDDYLAKPFAIQELVARVGALGRRGPTVRPTTLTVGPLAIDFTRRVATAASQVVPLTPREWDVLAVLADARGVPVSLDSLLERVWGDTTEKSRASLAVIASRIRRKLETAAGRPLIRTVRGVGYALEIEP